MSEQQLRPVEPLDHRVAEDLDSLNNFVPETLAEARDIVGMLREGYTGREDEVVDESLREELSEKLKSGVDMWRLSDEERTEWKNASAAKSWADLTPPMQNFMKSLRKDAYQPMGMVFASLQGQAERRLTLDDKLRNPLAEQSPVVETPQQPAPKLRALSRTNRADLEAIANARSRDEVSSALSREDLPKNSPLRGLELGPVDVNRPASAMESMRTVRESARQQLAQDDEVRAKQGQERRIKKEAVQRATHEEKLGQQREQWKDEKAALEKAEQGILTAWKFKHGGDLGLQRELARKNSDLMERVRSQARARVYGGDERTAFQQSRAVHSDVKAPTWRERRANPRIVEPVLPSDTVRDENKKTAEALNDFYRRQLLGSAAVAGMASKADATKVLDVPKDMPPVADDVADGAPKGRWNQVKAWFAEKRTKRRAGIAAGVLAVVAATGVFLATYESERKDSSGKTQEDTGVGPGNQTSPSPSPSPEAPADAATQLPESIFGVLPGEGLTHTLENMADQQGLSVSGQQLYEVYKTLAAEGYMTSGDVAGTYLMPNGDYGYDSTGNHDWSPAATARALELLQQQNAGN